VKLNLPTLLDRTLATFTHAPPVLRCSATGRRATGSLPVSLTVVPDTLVDADEFRLPTVGVAA
jgi:hypothetical protein